jgi:hypothetical protein
MPVLYPHKTKSKKVAAQNGVSNIPYRVTKDPTALLYCKNYYASRNNKVMNIPYELKEEPMKILSEKEKYIMSVSRLLADEACSLSIWCN